MEMKKIISLILVVLCLGAFVSCGGGVGGFESAMENTNPAQTIITTVTHTNLGDLNAEYKIMYKADGTAVMNYTYERFATLDEVSDEPIVVVSGSTTLAADGSYTGDVAGTIVGVSSTKFDLGEISDAVINEAGDILTATVPAADTEAVFGKAFSEDITLEMVMANDVISTVKMNSASMSIKIVHS